MIIKLDEGALLAAGFSKTHVELMRHLVAQIGAETGGTTLPEVAAQTDTLTPRVDALTITIANTNIAVSDIQVNETDLPFTDARIYQRLADLEADAERSQIVITNLLRALDDLRASTDPQLLNIADLRRRISQLEDAQT